MSQFKKRAKFKACIIIATGVVNLYSAFQTSSGAIRISGEEKDSLIVLQLADFASRAQRDYQRFFNYPLQKKVQVYLAESDEEYQRFYGWHVPEWSSGIAYTQQRIIILKPGVYYDPASYRMTLFHEIAHLFLHDGLSAGKLPVWLNEGTAMYLSGQVLSWQDYIAVGNALSAGKIPALGELTSLISFTGARARLGYMISLLAVQYIIEQHSEGQLREIIRDYSRGVAQTEVFKKNLNEDFIDYELAFYQHLKDKFKWTGFLQFDSFYLLALVLVIILSYISIKIRNRRIYRKWEQEESIDEGG